MVKIEKKIIIFLTVICSIFFISCGGKTVNPETKPEPKGKLILTVENISSEEKIPNAEVTIKLKGTTIEQKKITDINGSCEFPNLKLGTYEIDVKCKGYLDKTEEKNILQGNNLFTILLEVNRYGLIKNGGFEISGSGKGNSPVSYWISDKPGTETPSYETQGAYDGSGCILMDKTKGSGDIRIWQDVEIEPGKTYLITAYMKTEGSTVGAGAGLLVAVYNSTYDPAKYELKALPPEGTTYCIDDFLKNNNLLNMTQSSSNWKMISITYQTPAEAKYLRIILGINGDGMKAWFDEVGCKVVE